MSNTTDIRRQGIEDSFLWEAIKKGSVTDIQRLLESLTESQNVNEMRDSDGNSILLAAAALGYTKVIKFLLTERADVDMKLQNRNLETALHLATKKGFLHCVHWLVKFAVARGVDYLRELLEIVDCDGKRALEYATRGCFTVLSDAQAGDVFERKKFADGNYYRVNIARDPVDIHVPISTAATSTSASAVERSVVTPRKRNVDTATANEKYAAVRNPILRSWNLLSNANEDRVHTFSVVSYNILADVYTKPSYFPYATSEELSWEFRWRNLSAELVSLDADVFCLQEVQADHYEQFIAPLLASNGYAALFKKRSGSRREGCAVFYKTNRFDLESVTDIEYNDFTTEAFLKKNNVAQFVALRLKSSDNPLGVICFANTHIYYKSEAAKRQQIDVLLNEAKKWISQTNGKSPLIVCGDFNANPTSNIFKTIVEAQLPLSNSDTAAVRLVSAYAQQDAGSCIVGTSFTNSKPKILDYIWYSRTEHIVSGCLQLEVVGRLGYPDQPILLPNRSASSDHIPLKCLFQVAKL